MSGAKYGYQDDSPQSSGSGLVFGLNAGVARLTKFEWINDGGKDGVEQEALDIQFTIEGADRPVSFRKFPISKAFNNGAEITDPENPVFIKAVNDQNSLITHIMHVFVAPEAMKQAFIAPTESFKEYCAILKSLLPKDYDKVPLDIFGQYQWNLNEGAAKTYCELPKKMSYGRWLSQAITPVGKWVEVRKENPADSDLNALKYVDDAGNVHPFKRNGWFMKSAFANQQVGKETSNVAEGWSKAPVAQPPVAPLPQGTTVVSDEPFTESQTSDWDNIANQQ